MNMQLFVAFAFVLVSVNSASALSEDRRVQLQQWGKECVESTGVEPGKLSAIRRGEFVEDETVKTFLACVLKKSGSLNSDGTFNSDVVLADFADNPILHESITKCLSVTGSTAPESAWLSYRCFRTSIPTGHNTPWTIIRPGMIYAAPTWAGAARIHIKKLQVMQNKISRMITNRDRYTRTDDLHRIINLPPIDSHINDLSLNFFRKTRSNQNALIFQITHIDLGGKHRHNFNMQDPEDLQ